MGQIIIRKAENRDLNKITQYYRKLYEGDEEQEFYKSNLSLHMRKHGQLVFVALSNNKIIGYIWTVYYEHIKNKGVAYIEELFVDEKYRRTGVGRNLVNKIISVLKKKNIQNLYVAVGTHMHEAQKFYKALNFVNSPEKWFFFKINP